MSERAPERAGAGARERGEVEADLPARYRPLERLGAGAHGEVFRALDRRHGAEVAVKRLLRPDVASLVRFKREFRALADVRHSNLVALHELIYDEGRWLLVMEHVPGRDLPAHCGADPTRWRACLPGLAAGLSALHDAGYLHRDLSPGNVRVTPGGRVVLLDFGLASPLGRPADSFSSALATPPEQVAGAELGPASDWYAVGVLLYRGLAGVPPFAGARGPQLLARKLREDAPPIRSHRPDLDPGLAALADALLLRDPGERMRLAAPLLDALTGGASSAAEHAELEALPFVGRERELAALRDALDEARASGSPVHVRVRGPSGIGKTSLVERFAARAPEARAWWGRCFENEAVPFAGLDEIVDQLPRHVAGSSLAPEERAALGAMFPVLAPAAPEGDAAPIDLAEARRRAARGLGALLEEASGGRTPVLVLDDAQWGDEDTARLLARLEGPLLVITIVRDTELDRGLVTALDALRAPARTLSVGPLGPAEVAQVAAARAGADAALVHQQTQGLPLFVVEMLRGAHAESLAAALAARVAALPAPERVLLLGLAVAGRPLEPALALEAASRLGAPHPAGALVGLRGARLVRLRHAQRGTRVELAHASVGQAAVEVLAHDALAPVHAVIDDAMGALDVDDPEARAVHARAAGRQAHARALFRAAAQRASRTFAFERAARLYAEVLALEPDDAPALHRARGEALAAAGRSAEAAASFARALAGRQPDLASPETVDLARLEVEHLFHAGRLEEGYAALDRVVRAAGLPFGSARGAVLRTGLRRLWLRARGLRLSLGARADGELLARIDLGHSLGTALANVDSFRAADYVTGALAAALAAGDARRAGRSLAFVAAHASSGGARAAPRVRRMIAELERLHGATGDGYLAGVTDAVRCLLLFHTGEYRESLALARACEDRFRRQPGAGFPLATVRERVTAQIYQCANLAMLGSFDALDAQRRRLVEDAEARGDRFAMTNGASGLMNVVWLARGEPEVARAEAMRAIARWSDRTFTVQHAFDVVAQARIDLYEDAPDRALARLHAARTGLRRSLLFRMPFLRVHVLDLVARAGLMRAGRGDEVDRAARIAASIRAEPARCYAPFADALDAAVAWRRGDRERAAQRACDAREGYRALAMSAHAALADRLVAACGGRAEEIAARGVADPDALGRALVPVVT